MDIAHAVGVYDKWGEEMSRYIDADDVANAIYHHFPSVRTMADARSVIEEVPTIEAVSVVRCKECKHYKQSESFCENGNGLWQAGDECFCSYGEREGE